MVDNENNSEPQEEISNSFKIENTINDMLNKVMEDNASLNSFDSEMDEFKEDIHKISRYSTRHQTSNSSNLIHFNRGNKRNLTAVLNSHKPSPPFNSNFNSSDSFLMSNPSFCFQNNSNNNLLYYHNNIKQSFQSQQPFNTQFNNNINNPNFIRNSLPYSKTVVHNNQKDVFKNSQNSQPMINFNNYFTNKNKNNNTNNIFIGNNINNPYFSINLESDFKRGKKRKKTYTLPDTLHNNISNFLQENNNIINETVNNKIKSNNNVNDGFIYELKTYLEKNGKIDFNIYNLIKGRFLSVIKNHKGSKLFQKYFKSTIPEEIIHLLYIELRDNLEEFITDAYANYFCKKFFMFLNQTDRIDFLTKIHNSIVRYSCDNIGTYPIQAIIENLNSNIEKNIIILSIKDHVEKLVYDSYGAHVLEKIITCIGEEDIPFIYTYISDNFLKIAYNNNGICIIKKILTFTHKVNLHNKIRKIILDNAFDLIQHPYGNFVIQVVVEFWPDYKNIIFLFKKYFFSLSMEKYASNVIERFIEKDEEILNNYIDEIISSKKIYEIMKSNYGNYVIQKAIKLSKNRYKNKLIYAAAKQINNLMDIKLIIKWKSILLPHIKELNNEQLFDLQNQKFFE